VRSTADRPRLMGLRLRSGTLSNVTNECITSLYFANYTVKKVIVFPTPTESLVSDILAEDGKTIQFFTVYTVLDF
jgi:hypothetical protein